MPGTVWDLGEWEQALTIRVGQAYVCRECQNVVMVTKGGIGNLELICCGCPMEKMPSPGAEASS
jgi:hypothetical protein